jgi:hypothetical protein
MAISNTVVFLSTLMICSLAFTSAISLKVKTKTSQYYDPTNLFNSVVSFQSYNYPQHHMRHRNFNIWSEEGSGDLYQKDASFIIRPALNGREGFVSFESVNVPGQYIRHQNWYLRISNGNSELFQNDASFQIVFSRVGDSNFVSFESSNYPGHFIRHQNKRGRISRSDNSNLFNMDASWQLVPALTQYYH